MALRQAYSSGQPTPFHGMYRTEKVLGGNIPILASDLSTGNQVALLKIPAGFVLQAIRLDTAQLDSNGSPTLTVSLGDTANNTRFLNASTAFRAAAANVLASVLGIAGYQFNADTDLLMTFTAGAATPVAGTIVCMPVGFINA